MKEFNGGRTGAAITFASATVFATTKFQIDPVAPWSLATLAVLTAAAACTARTHALHISLFCLLFASTRRLLPLSHAVWPFPLLIPLLIYAGAVFAVPRLGNSVTWLRAGKLYGKLLLVILATAVVSGVALAVWFHWAPVDPGRYAGRIPEMPLGLLVLAGLGFAALNAAMEEAAFRGIVMTALEHTLGAGVAAVCVQAFLFGAAHYLSGFPNGAWGVAMTSVYGLVLGVLRRMSGGLLAPWLAHTLADGVVFALVAGVAGT